MNTIIGMLLGTLIAVAGHYISARYHANRLIQHRIAKTRWKRERKQLKEAMLQAYSAMKDSKGSLPTNSKGFKKTVLAMARLEHILERLYGRNPKT
jgi:hypothetical protein